MVSLSVSPEELKYIVDTTLERRMFEMAILIILFDSVLFGYFEDLGVLRTGLIALLEIVCLFIYFRVFYNFYKLPRDIPGIFSMLFEGKVMTFTYIIAILFLQFGYLSQIMKRDRENMSKLEYTFSYIL